MLWVQSECLMDLHEWWWKKCYEPNWSWSLISGLSVLQVSDFMVKNIEAPHYRVETKELDELLEMCCTHKHGIFSYHLAAVAINAWCHVEVRAWGFTFTWGAASSDKTGSGREETAAGRWADKCSPGVVTSDRHRGVVLQQHIHKDTQPWLDLTLEKQMTADWPTVLGLTVQPVISFL